MSVSGGLDWQSIILWVGGGFGAAVAAFWQGRRKKTEQPAGEATVLAASFTDPKVFRQLTEATEAMAREVERFREQQHDDSRALRAAIEELTGEVKRNTAAQGAGAISPHDLAALIVTMKGK